MQSVQDDNACPAAPIPGNGVRISFDVLLRELEKRNYALDQDAYALGQSEFLVQSIGEHFFWYEGENYTMEEWFPRTGQYIMLTKDGRTRVRNSVAWTVYCEEIW